MTRKGKVAQRNWRVWDYNNKLLGEVCAGTLGEARKTARAVWPAQLAGERLFDIVRGGQSPVQPTGVQCGECLGWHIAYTGEFCKRCGQPEGQDDREPARLRAQLSEKEAEIARMKDCGRWNPDKPFCGKCLDCLLAQLAALRVERDEARAATQRANEGAAQARAAQAKAEKERATHERDALKFRADLIAAEAERDAARTEVEGLREALVNTLEALRIALANLAEPGAQPRPADVCPVDVMHEDVLRDGWDPCGNPLPCAEHPTSKEKE